MIDVVDEAQVPSAMVDRAVDVQADALRVGSILRDHWLGLRGAQYPWSGSGGAPATGTREVERGVPTAATSPGRDPVLNGDLVRAEMVVTAR